MDSSFSRRKTKSVFCACAITFQTQSTELARLGRWIGQHFRARGRALELHQEVAIKMRNLFVELYICLGS